MKPSLKIVHLYGDLLKSYGDRGNVVTLRNRAAWRGIDVDVITIGVGQALPEGAGLVFIGGGSDRIQGLIADDLSARHGELDVALQRGAVVLAVCGGYQLLGTSYEAADGNMLPGLGLLDVTTRAGEGRLVGDVVARCTPEGGGHELVGFENHGGRTFLGPGASPLAVLRSGNGNNGLDGTEGAVRGRVVGTYLHGPVLALNPGFADQILAMAMGLGGSGALMPLDDSIEVAAHDRKAGKRNRSSL